MRTFLITLLVGVTVLLTTCAGGQTFTGKAKAVADTDLAWSAAFHAGNLDQVMDFIFPDASVLAPNLPIATGKEQIAAAFKPFISIPKLDFLWKPVHVEVAPSGDVAFSDGTYSMSYPGPGGKLVVDNGKYLTIWRLDKSGKWKVVRDMFNTDLPAAH
jgi:ketosteroid isomerase-like protein